MEALLNKSAKLRENHMTLKEDNADERQWSRKQPNLKVTIDALMFNCSYHPPLARTPEYPGLFEDDP